MRDELLFSIEMTRFEDRILIVVKLPGRVFINLKEYMMMVNFRMERLKSAICTSKSRMSFNTAGPYQTYQGTPYGTRSEGNNERSASHCMGEFCGWSCGVHLGNGFVDGIALA